MSFSFCFFDVYAGETSAGAVSGAAGHISGCCFVSTMWNSCLLFLSALKNNYNL